MPDSSVLAASDIETLTSIMRFCCIPSLFTCMIILSLFWIFKEIRGISIDNIIFLTFSEILYCISSLLPFYPDNPYSLLCKFQSFLINYCLYSRYIWTAIISYCCLTNTLKHDYLERNKHFYRILFFVIAISIPLGLSIYLVASNSSGNSGCYCWLAIDSEDRRNFIVRNEIFFLFFKVTLMILILFFVIKTARILEVQRRKSKNKLGDNEHLKYYPIVLLTASLGGVINGIVNIISINTVYLWLIIIQLILDSIQGILIFLIFILSPGLRHSISTLYSNLTRRQLERPSVFMAQNDIYDDGSNVLYPSMSTRTSRNSISSHGSRAYSTNSSYIEEDEYDDTKSELKEIN